MNDFLQSGRIFEKKESNTIQYVINDNNLFSLTEFKVLKNQTASFIRCEHVMYNGKVKLIYFSSDYKSLQSIISMLNAEDFLLIVAELFKNITEIEENGFLVCKNLDLSIDKIFVDNNMQVYLIYLPLNNYDLDKYSFENNLRTNLINLINNTTNLYSESISKLSFYLSNSSYTLSQLYQVICQLLNSQPKSNELKGQRPLLFSSVNAINGVNFRIDKPVFLIGKKSDEVDGLITYNMAISRVHCKIIYYNGDYYIVDLGSVNGTYVNGVRLMAQQSMILKNDDIVRLANSDFKITL